MNSKQFSQEIDELYARCKSGDLSDRQARFDEIEALTERYFAANGEMPDYRLLDRLSTLCLREEMTDSNPHKTKQNEYPVMSENQRRRKTEGRHVKRYDKDGKLLPLNREVPLSLAENYGTDGGNYNYPARRMPDVIEQLDMEYNGRSGSNDD